MKIQNLAYLSALVAIVFTVGWCLTIPEKVDLAKAGDCDYSIVEGSFHTEGVMPNGDLWQISSYNGRYYSRVYNHSTNKDEVQELDNYKQALDITTSFFGMGWGCK